MLRVGEGHCLWTVFKLRFRGEGANSTFCVGMELEGKSLWVHVENINVRYR